MDLNLFVSVLLHKEALHTAAGNQTNANAGLWNGNDCEASEVSRCDCHNSGDLYLCLRQH